MPRHCLVEYLKVSLVVVMLASKQKEGCQAYIIEKEFLHAIPFVLQMEFLNILRATCERPTTPAHSGDAYCVTSSQSRLCGRQVDNA